MEDGKRKKKNKKNKGKLTKTAENVSELTRPSFEEALQTGPEGNHESVPEQNHQEPDPGTVGTQNVSVSESEGELERHKAKESKLADLEETVKHFQNSIISCIETEASLEKKIKLLQNENEFFVKKEISWNSKFEQLQSEIHSLSLKEASLENRLTTVEHEKDSRTCKENSVSEMISRLEEANTALQMQVKELERSRDTLVQENQQLTSSFSLLEARVQDLESEAACFRLSTATMTKHIADDKDSVKQVETVTEPSEKLVAVETELVRKVNQQNGVAELSATCHASSTEPDLITLATTHLPQHEEKVSELTDKFASSETVFETINIADADEDHHIASGVHPKELPLLDDLNESTEIVQIPLDGNQAQQEEAQDTKTDEEVGLPLSDAPLIGAPFRFISFVAKYVSGSDLVENRHNSDR